MTKKRTDKLKDVNLGQLPTLSGQDPIVEHPLLTMDEMKQIEAQARAEVEAEQKATLRSDYLAKVKADLKKQFTFKAGKNDIGEKVEKIFIDLPKFSDRIVIDGTVYFHGQAYSFEYKKAATIREIIYRQWLHHAEINGLDMNELLGRKKYQSVIRPE